jgi:hypothetical protein
VEQFAQLFLLLIATALTIRLVQGGWSGPNGVKDWLAAKFLNKPPAGAVH